MLGGPGAGRGFLSQRRGSRRLALPAAPSAHNGSVRSIGSTACRRRAPYAPASPRRRPVRGHPDHLHAPHARRLRFGVETRSAAKPGRRSASRGIGDGARGRVGDRTSRSASWTANADRTPRTLALRSPTRQPRGDAVGPADRQLGIPTSRTADPDPRCRRRVDRPRRPRLVSSAGRHRVRLGSLARAKRLEPRRSPSSGCDRHRLDAATCRQDRSPPGGAVTARSARRSVACRASADSLSTRL